MAEKGTCFPVTADAGHGDLPTEPCQHAMPSHLSDVTVLLFQRATRPLRHERYQRVMEGHPCISQSTVDASNGYRENASGHDRSGRPT
jgi:hypothetical protein